MAVTLSITIDEKCGQIRLPLEASKIIRLKQSDWLQVKIESDEIVLNPVAEEEDEELIKALIHEGVLLDMESMAK
jgi:hypothetical protein